MALVFKVKFQDTLRRWTVTESVNADSFPVTFGQLEAKIKELFRISSSASLAITYTDSDDDVVTLANDQDLVDACIVQCLNPLRLDVQVLNGGISIASESAEVLPSTTDSPMPANNVNSEALLNALVPQATADAVKGFMRTYIPFIHPDTLAAACPGKAENAFKEFVNGFAGHHPGNPKSVGKHHHHHNHHQHHPRKFLNPALFNGHHGDTSFHWGIVCDGCGVSPIEGIRYKSTKESNYDLCGKCFEAVGKETDFEKLDRPVYTPPLSSLYRPPFLKRGARPNPAPPGFRATFSRGPNGWKHNTPFSYANGSSASDGHKKLDARFVKDVTIFDGTEVSPGIKFTKIWRMSNIGTAPWPQSTQLVHIGGDVLCAEKTVPLELSEAGLPCGEEMEVSVDLTAPEKPGRYVSHWRLADPFGQKFGHRVWVVIHVVSQGEHSPQFQASLQNENLNVEARREAMDVDLDAANTVIMDVDLDAANTVTMDVDVDGVDKVVLDVMFVGESPIIEKLLTEDPPRSSPHSSITCPDAFSHGVKEVGMSTSKSSEVVVDPDSTSEDLKGVGMSTEKASEDGGAHKKNEVDGFSLVEKPSESADWFEVGESESLFTPERQKEEAEEEGEQEYLVQALEAMGFTDRSANISVLQRRNFVLQDAVDDLLVEAGWKGALEDLGEMGFVDKATNVRLLVKNKGSLKQTVRELVKLEKQAV